MPNQKNRQNIRTVAPNYSYHARPNIFQRRLMIVIAVFALLFGAVSVSKWYFADHYDVLLLGGTVIDGSGSRAKRADVGIKGDKIAFVGRAWFDTADKTIDVSGKMVAPGFIDVHTHIESSVGESDEFPVVAENFIKQGITTVLTGNCGRSFKAGVEKLFDLLSKRGISINVGTLVGHNTIRQRVMGEESRKPTAVELKEMQSLVKQAMKQGAFGLSTGLEYAPGMFSTTDEIIALAKVAAEDQGIYATHMRDEGNSVTQGIEESLSVSRLANIPLQISHLKVRGRKNWRKSGDIIARIKQAQSDGLKISFDAYPYAASSTGIDILLPELTRKNPKWRKSLSDPIIRQQVVSEIVADMRMEGWKDFSFARVASFSPNQSFNGKTIPEIVQLVENQKLLGVLDKNAGKPIALPSSEQRTVAKPLSKVAPTVSSKVSPKPLEKGKTKPHPKPREKKALIHSRDSQASKNIYSIFDNPLSYQHKWVLFEIFSYLYGSLSQQSEQKEKQEPKEPVAKEPTPKTEESSNIPKSKVLIIENGEAKELNQSLKPEPVSPLVSEAEPNVQKKISVQDDQDETGYRNNNSEKAPSMPISSWFTSRMVNPVYMQAEVVCYLASQGGAQMVYENMSQEDVDYILSQPDCMLGSDSAIRGRQGEGKPHPRGWGSAPRFLSLAREGRLFSFEEVIQKMTALPAKTFQIKGRGLLKPGYMADIVVFDPNIVKDEASKDDPFRPPQGIDQVLLNGKVVLEHGKLKVKNAGAVLRKTVQIEE